MIRKICYDVSIHAPRMGSDSSAAKRLIIASCFNPRSPCGERLAGGWSNRQKGVVSIHAPRVGSDYVYPALNQIPANRFNPRSPCGERLQHLATNHLL